MARLEPDHVFCLPHEPDHVFCLPETLESGPAPQREAKGAGRQRIVNVFKLAAFVFELLFGWKRIRNEE